MSSRPLDADTALGVKLSAICSRNRYTKDAGPVIAELLETADERVDVLAREAGMWSGFYDSEHTYILAAALLETPGASTWAQVGKTRRDAPWHSTPGTT